MREQLTAGLDISAVELHLGDRAVEGIDQDRPDIHTDFFLAWSARGLEGIEPAIDRLGTVRDRCSIDACIRSFLRTQRFRVVRSRQSIGLFCPTLHWRS